MYQRMRQVGFIESFIFFKEKKKMTLKSNLVNDAQQLVRQKKKACVANLCEIIHKKVMETSGQIPYSICPI